MPKSKPRFDAAASITDEIVSIIDRGVLPWRKPWTVGGSAVPLRCASWSTIAAHLADNSIKYQFCRLCQRNFA